MQRKERERGEGEKRAQQKEGEKMRNFWALKKKFVGQVAVVLFRVEVCEIDSFTIQ
jgi:hypothetical protein